MFFAFSILEAAPPNQGSEFREASFLIEARGAFLVRQARRLREITPEDADSESS